MSRFQTFDMSRFQQLFPSPTDATASLPENFITGNGKNLGDASGEFEASRNTDSPHVQRRVASRNTDSQHVQRRVARNRVGKLKNNQMSENMTEGRTGNGKVKKPKEDNANYGIFDTLPKFDPRFALDRAYRLMDALQPPDEFKLPSVHISFQ